MKLLYQCVFPLTDLVCGLFITDQQPNVDLLQSTGL